MKSKTDSSGYEAGSPTSTHSANASSLDVAEAKLLFKQNALQTIAYWAAFLTFGLCVAVLGPTLLDLGCITKSTISEMSYVIFAQVGCTLIGSIIAGYITSRINPNVILLWSTVVISVTMCLVAFCETRGQLLADFMVMGLFMGLIDTVANVRLIQLYGNCVAPFLQALHFSYGFGAFLSPIIAEPFLKNEDCSTIVSDLEHSTMNHKEGIELRRARKESTVGDAYIIYGLLQIPSICLLVIILFQTGYNNSLKSRGTSDKQQLSCHPDSIMERDDTAKSLEAYEELGGSVKGENKTGTEVEMSENEEHNKYDDDSRENLLKAPLDGAPPTKFTTVAVVIFTGLILFCADAGQSAYGAYIYAYSDKNKAIEISSTTGAYLTASFWGSFALGRLFSIPLSTVVSSPLMLFVNLAGSGFAIILFFNFTENVPVIFVSTSIYGLFLSSIYPSGIAMAEEYLSLTSFMTSVLVMMAGAGELCSPLLVGWMFEKVGPISLIYYEFALSIMGLLFLTVTVIIAFKQMSKPAPETRRPNMEASRFWWLPSNNSDFYLSLPILSKRKQGGVNNSASGAKSGGSDGGINGIGHSGNNNNNNKTKSPGNDQSSSTTYASIK